MTVAAARPPGGPTEEAGKAPLDPPTALPTSGRLLAVDIGAKRIGLALSDPDQILAQPLATVTRRPGRRFPLARLRPYLAEHAPVGVVVGLPLTPDGRADERTEEAWAVGRLLRHKTGLPVCAWDERMSTARALTTVKELGGGTRGRKGEVDQLAAASFLQAFLERRRGEGG